MTNKCKVQGSEVVEQCENSIAALERGYIESVRMTDMETHQKRFGLALKIKEKKHNTALMHYCPWCGSKIATKYTE